jgi:thiopeptide-type bacteriocin biosynthesis protein
MAENSSSVVSNDKAQPMIGQFIAPLYLDECVYDYPVSMNVANVKGSKRSFMPGSEWLYFKIYCHPVWSNELLANILLPMLNSFYRKKTIDKWFFVRYADPDYHIRLRLHVDKKTSNDIMMLFSKKMKKLLDERVIEKYYIDTYVRELERYTSWMIEDVETFFFSSSLLSLQYLKESGQQDDEYALNLEIILLSLDEMLNAFGCSLEQKVAAFFHMYSGFYKEFGEGKDLKKSLDKKYNELRKNLNVIYEEMAERKKGNLAKYYEQLYVSSVTIAARMKKKKYAGAEKIIADLIHMHLNRLFVQNPRRQELIIYYLLYKHYNAVVFKNKSAG